MHALSPSSCLGPVRASFQAYTRSFTSNDRDAVSCLLGSWMGCLRASVLRGFACRNVIICAFSAFSAFVHIIRIYIYIYMCVCVIYIYIYIHIFFIYLCICIYIYKYMCVCPSCES